MGLRKLADGSTFLVELASFDLVSVRPHVGSHLTYVGVLARWTVDRVQLTLFIDRLRAAARTLTHFSPGPPDFLKKTVWHLGHV
jgi:hypothetical protein